MTDIVERLREVNMRWWREPEHAVVVKEAAAEITRLTGEVENLRNIVNTRGEILDERQAELTSLRAEVERLRRALG